MIIAAIDPGLNGGIALLDSDGTLSVVVMPLIEKQMHPKAIYNYFVKQKKIDHVFIEKCQPMPKQGVSSTFNYGVGFGYLQGVVCALNIPYTLVRPREWQKELHKSADASADPKARSAFVAYSLFPHQEWKATPRCKKDHDGMIDAALIVMYGSRLIGQGLNKTPTPHLHSVG